MARCKTQSVVYSVLIIPWAFLLADRIMVQSRDLAAHFEILHRHHKGLET